MLLKKEMPCNNKKNGVTESTPLTSRGASSRQRKRITWQLDDNPVVNRNENGSSFIESSKPEPFFRNNDDDDDDGDDDDDDDKHFRTCKERVVSHGAIVSSVLALVLCVFLLLLFLFEDWHMYDAGSSHHHNINDDDDEQAHVQRFDENGRYILEDYDGQATFSDFLPALAGIYGKPLYAFFVNRGQGIASFGVESKDYPILEFNSATKAYQNTALLGFRTFLQGKRGRKTFSAEPFNPLYTRYDDTTTTNINKDQRHLKKQQQHQQHYLPKRYMYVGGNELQIQEIDTKHNIETNVTYFILPEEDFGAFVRRTTFTNKDTVSKLSLSILDGLARMEPAGGKLDLFLKNMGTTVEAWMNVYQPYNDTQKMPFYRLTTEATDQESVVIQEAGHYCLSIVEGDPSKLLPIVYDTSKIFGQDKTLLRPVMLEQKLISEILREKQYGAAKTSSAFAGVDSIILKPGESITISTFFGRAENIMDVPLIYRRISTDGFPLYKMMRSRAIIQQISSIIESETSSKLFDGHVQQMFLDNSLSGGIPTVMGEVNDDVRMRNADEDRRLKVYHLFNRNQGDLERDYNDFVIEPTFFSQGPGNFRDVIQNRRNDVIFNPRIGAFNVKHFLSYIQADGYNPLSVEAYAFEISNRDICNDLAAAAVGRADGHRAQREALTEILNHGPFRPGQLFALMKEQKIELIINRENFIDSVAAAAEYVPMGKFEEGFWADHWTYYMDLIESYISMFPEGEGRLLFDEQLPYFFSPASVQPRNQKYVLSVSYDGHGRHVQQLGATVEDEVKDSYRRKNFFESSTGQFKSEAHWQHKLNENLFKSSPIEKLFLLATLKFATRDPYGMGIEYEGGKPGWNEASNGLVAMVGSGMPETYELLMLLRYILSAITKYDRPIFIPIELNDLITSINYALDELSSNSISTATKIDIESSTHQVRNGSSSHFINRTSRLHFEALDTFVPEHFFKYWDTVATAREKYRERVRTIFSGTTEQLAPTLVKKMITRWMSEIDQGVNRALYFGSRGLGDDGSSGVTPTYFTYNITKWNETGMHSKDGHPLVNALQMKLSSCPLFLEGPTRMMKTVKPKHARDIYSDVRKSPLRDEKLGMYTVSASLQGQSLDMGRMVAFAQGWMENQSVMLHMSYKFYLELIRKGLFVEFYDELKTGGMLPFIDPSKYGRSVMECSSFIASSAFQDPSIQGRGFLARLSGSTSEFLSIWILMMVGPKPFFMDEHTGEVRMQLIPAIPLWMFKETRNNNHVKTLGFKLFGAIDVKYHNTLNQDLFRIPPSRYVIGFRDGSTYIVNEPSIPFDLADKIRRVVFTASIDVYFDNTEKNNK